MYQTHAHRSVILPAHCEMSDSKELGSEIPLIANEPELKNKST